MTGTIAARPAPPATVPADVTGSIAARPDATKDESRPPVMQGWVLRNVYDGTALIQNRQGILEVEVGDPLPGGGKVEAIKRQDGRWVVVTSRGIIVSQR